MPPQLGAFAIPYSAQHKGRPTPNAEIVEVGTSYQHQPAAGPSRIHGVFVHKISSSGSYLTLLPANGNGNLTEEAKKDKRRKEMVGKLGKEMSDRRDECVPESPHLRCTR